MSEREIDITTVYTDYKTNNSDVFKNIYRSPGQIEGPSELYCEGQRWRGGHVEWFPYAAYYNEGVFEFEEWFDMRDSYESFETTVEAIDDSISTPLGNMPAVKVVSINEFGQKTIKWIHASTGIVLRIEYFTSSGRLWKSSTLKQIGE